MTKLIVTNQVASVMHSKMTMQYYTIFFTDRKTKLSKEETS